MKLIITPKTKVFALLEAFPELEAELIGYVPAFEKLRNPVLRNTVARVASLQQAAAVGGVPVADLVNRLRKAVGQESLTGMTESLYNTVQPLWFDESLPTTTLDAQSQLDRGEQPIDTALAALADLKPGHLYRVIAPFLPAPMIDKATSLGLSHWVIETPGKVVVWFGGRLTPPGVPKVK